MLLACLYLWGLNGAVKSNSGCESYVEGERANLFAHSTHTTHDILLEGRP